MSKRSSRRQRQTHKRQAKAQTFSWYEIIELHTLIKNLIGTNQEAISAATNPNYLPHLNRFAAMFDVHGITNDLERYVLPHFKTITEKLDVELANVKNPRANVTDYQTILRITEYFTALSELQERYSNLVLPSVTGLAEVVENAAMLYRIQNAAATQSAQA